MAAFVRRDEAAVALAIVGGVGIDASRGHAPGGLHGRQNGIAPAIAEAWFDRADAALLLGAAPEPAFNPARPPPAPAPPIAA